MQSVDISNFEGRDLLDFLDTSIADFSNFEIRLIYSAEYSQSKMIRDAVLYLFERNNIDVPWKNRFALIVDELVNNSIEYGSLPLDKNEVSIRFSSRNGKLSILIEVSDTGRGVESKTSREMEEIRKQKEMEGFQSYIGKR